MTSTLLLLLNEYGARTSWRTSWTTCTNMKSKKARATVGGGKLTTPRGDRQRDEGSYRVLRRGFGSQMGMLGGGWLALESSGSAPRKHWTTQMTGVFVIIATPSGGKVSGMTYVSEKVPVPADRSRINTADPVEVRWWSKLLGCSQEQLQQAVSRVGDSAAHVEHLLDCWQGFRRWEPARASGGGQG